MLDPHDIERRFDRAAASFDDADFVHAITRDGIASRLEPLIIEGNTILDLGSATGATGRLMRKRFRRAHVVALDLSHAMLVQARNNKPWFARSSFVQANAERLPFGDARFDVIVANQVLPWIREPQSLFTEVARVLRKGGLFAFATLGPDSLVGVPGIGSNNRVFDDMHDVGDGLVRAGLCDPVLDVDRVSVRYENPDRLLDDLARLGVPELPENATAAPGLSLELELVYGHCWGNGPRPDPGNVRIDANRIPLRR